MSILNSIKQATSNVISSVKNTFNPSEKVAEQRRIDIIGTPSKSVTTAVVVGTAATAIAAPVLIAKAGGVKVVTEKAVEKVASLPLTTKILGGVVGAPVIAGTVAKDPTIVTKVPGKVIEFEKDLYKASKEPSLSSFADVLKENKEVSLFLGATALAAGGATAVNAYNTFSNTQAIKENTEATQKVIDNTLNPDDKKTKITDVLPTNNIKVPETVIPTATGTSLVPLTPETQVLGKSVRSSTIKKHKHRKTTPTGNIRININNQTKSLYIPHHY